MSSANLTRTETQQRSAAIDLTDVEVRLDVRDATNLDRTDFPVSVRLHFTATAAQTWLDFIGAGIDSLKVNEQPAQINWDGARLELAGLRTDGSVNQVEVQARAVYSTSGQGLHRFVDPADGETYLYSHLAPADARRLFPLFEQPDLKACFTITVDAPAPWVVVSNQPVAQRDDHGAMAAVSFEPTPPISTYLVALMAGPWHRVSDAWSLPDQNLEIPLGLLCRQSLADYLDPDAIFTITKQGLTHYHQLFDYPYPWGKYDQVFAPEYNIGAMENPGCVTFNEKFIFQSVPTRAQHQSRANVILHEMAHMWFGDLVTARWWDDLWLNESFAEYMGTSVSAEATQFTDAWIPFADQRKAWAYSADQLPSTHPIVADIADLVAADQNFDGITYAKGASVLKQLVTWVGEDAFFAGVRRYFRAHEFGNATLADLLTELEAASGRDLGRWAAEWLTTSGPSLLAAGWVNDSRTLRITQSLPVGADGPLRAHRLAVGLYQTDGESLVRVERHEVEVDGAQGEATFSTPYAADELVLVNDDDLTYARVHLDEASTSVALRNLSQLRNPMARALVWSMLWEATRDGALSAVAYLRAVLEHGGAEVQAAVLQTQIQRVHLAVERYLPAHIRQAAREDWFAGARAHAEAAEAGSDRQRIWATAAFTAGGMVPAAAEWLRPRLAGEPGPLQGLVMDHDLRWLALQSLAGLGVVTADDLDAELENDNTSSGWVARLRAHTAQPRREIKEQIWEHLHTPGKLTNTEVDAAIGGFGHPEPSGLIDRFVDRYFDGLEQVWQDFPIELSQRLVRGLFPHTQDLGEVAPADHPMLGRVHTWLAEHPQAPSGLRRIITDQADLLRRALMAQAKVGR